MFCNVHGMQLIAQILHGHSTLHSPVPCLIAEVFRSLPGSRHLKLKRGMILPAILFLAWCPRPGRWHFYMLSWELCPRNIVLKRRISRPAILFVAWMQTRHRAVLVTWGCSSRAARPTWLRPSFIWYDQGGPCNIKPLYELRPNNLAIFYRIF